MKNLQQLVQQTIDWNIKVGNKTHPAFTSEFELLASRQAELVLEEAQETFDSSIVSDYREMLDGACDILFTLSYYVYLLEQAGFDFEGAYQAVIDNNSTKIFNSYYQACDAKTLLEQKSDSEYTVETNMYNGLPFYTIVNQKGKVCKPVDFVAVELEGFIPK